MPGLAGPPCQSGDRLAGGEGRLGRHAMLFRSALPDIASIIPIVAPPFLPPVEPMGLSLVRCGVITVVGAAIVPLSDMPGLSSPVHMITSRPEGRSSSVPGAFFIFGRRLCRAAAIRGRCRRA